MRCLETVSLKPRHLWRGETVSRIFIIFDQVETGTGAGAKDLSDTDKARAVYEELVAAQEGKTRSRKNVGVTERLESLIEYQRLNQDGTLDYADAVVVGGRGWLPNVCLHGYGKAKLERLKSHLLWDSTESLRSDIVSLVGECKSEGHIFRPLIHYLAFVDRFRRSSGKNDLASKFLDEVMEGLLSRAGVRCTYNVDVMRFWKNHSEKPNDQMDFEGIVSINASSDPAYLYEAFQKTLPRALVIKATGASGIRLRQDFPDNYFKLLEQCQKAEIPVVITAGSRGEVTSLEYGPGYELFDQDLAFFAGTMDDDLVQPRVALLNAPENRRFLENLVNTLDVSDTENDGAKHRITDTERREIKRNILRQLLSGSHYRRPAEGEMPDRFRVEQKYGIETRVDLLGGMHVKKAILASWLNEITRWKINLPYSSCSFL